MADSGLEDKKNTRFDLLHRDLAVMSKAREHMKRSELVRAYDEELSKLAATINNISKDNDIKKSISAEETCLQYEAKYLTNSKEQASSLKTALAQVPAAEKSTSVLLGNKQVYQEAMIDGFGKKGKGRDGLPNDGAREFLASQKARLDTLSKGWGSDSEKAFFKARHKMLDVTEKLYANEQRKALGLEEEKTKPAAKEASPVKSEQQQAHEKVFESLVANLPPDKQKQALEYFNKRFTEQSQDKTPATVAINEDKQKAPGRGGDKEK